MARKILVTGANGQLGSELAERAGNYELDQFTFVDKEQLDLSQVEAIESYFENYQYDLIINCAAHTAVDKAEEQKELANQLNHLAVKKLAEIAKDQNSVLIHISTDYVFSGQSYLPYKESDKTSPINTYGSTKLKGEQAVLKIAPKGLIIRTSWVYSSYGANFVKTMLSLSKQRDSLNIIVDQVGTPTYAGDLADAILGIISHSDFEEKCQNQKIYHYSNEGICSWYDFAQTIFSLMKIDCKVGAIETKDYPTEAKRPQYTVMNKAKIKQEWGVVIPYWHNSLKKCLKKLNKGSIEKK